jgi:outer membrane protein assembly factor BamD (BamD/ComL family)
MYSMSSRAKHLVRCSVILCVANCLLSHALAQTLAVNADVKTANVPQNPVRTNPTDPLIDAAFDHFYNMDYERATQEFGKVLDRHPNDPACVNHLLSTILLRELYRMGAMNTGEFANDSFIGQAHRPADPKVKE